MTTQLKDDLISFDHNPNYTQRPVLITGGAGFIGTNLALRLLSLGQRVIIFDNLSRAGVDDNLQWIRRHFSDQIQVRLADTRDKHAISDAVDAAGMVFHLAAQVAVTTSIDVPIRDFEINAMGTINLLEAIRTSKHQPPLVYTSTNKVYGNMDHMLLRCSDTRYEPADQHMAIEGVGENCPLSFHSPYGCSKGCADQYVLDYARTYGIKAVAFRMSCIYGPYQQGNEDQGWVAHFLIRAIQNQPITIYGDGKQVRDILFAEDLINAFLLAQMHMARLTGQAFNIGGGSANTISLVELIDLISQLSERQPEVSFDQWRTGDQRYYVSNTAKFTGETNWHPRITVRRGIEMLYNWLYQKNRAQNAVPELAKVGALQQ